MSNELEVQVARQDERINAIREELRSGFDRLASAFEKHAADNARRLGALENGQIAVQSSWRTVVVLAAAVSGAVHFAVEVARAMGK